VSDGQKIYKREEMNGQGVQRFILYFSKQCPHCTRFRQMLVKKPDLESKFVQLCVDNGAPPPPFVRSVPFIVVYDEKGRQQQLTDSGAFNWLKVQMEQHAGDFEAYDCGAMSSTLSDSYSYIVDTTTTTVGPEKNFEWLDGHKVDRTIYTPGESSYGGGLSHREGMPPNTLEKLLEQRNKDIPTQAPNGQRPPKPDFSKPASQPPHPKTLEQQHHERKQDPRIAMLRHGIDFGAPSFHANQPNMMRNTSNQGPRPVGLAAIHRSQLVQQHHHHPQYARSQQQIIGRRLPQNLPR
jgi:hypothetical protein